MAHETYEDLLDMIATCRDQHLRQAADWQRSMEHYAATGDRMQVSDASGMIERNNFAAATLSNLLAKAERRGKRIELIKEHTT